MDAHNYELLSKLVSKPWTHMANVGLGGMLATLYYEILVFRRVDSEHAKMTFFPGIYRLHKSRFIGMILVAFGLLLITANLVGTMPNQADPNLASETENALFFAVSRPSFVFGVFCIMVAIFLGQFNLGLSLLSGENMRKGAKCIIICCVL